MSLIHKLCPALVLTLGLGNACVPGWELIVEEAYGDDDSADPPCIDADGDGYSNCPGLTDLASFGLCDPAIADTREEIRGCAWALTESWWPSELGWLYHQNTDCNDSDASVHPNAEEVCNGVDDDCNPWIVEDVSWDEDGFTICEGDCADDEDDVYLGAPIVVGDGEDQDCDGVFE